jgi:hypothetical protein
VNNPFLRIRPTEMPPEPPRFPKVEDRWIAILNPKPGRPITGTIITERPLWVLTHWVNPTGIPKDGRTRPHLGTDDTCPLCLSLDQKPRWVGYIGVWLVNPARYVMFQLSLHSAQTCPPLEPDATLDLRGRSIVIKRVGAAANSPVMAQLGTDPTALELLPPELNMRPALLRLWDVRSSDGWVMR